MVSVVGSRPWLGFTLLVLSLGLAPLPVGGLHGDLTSPVFLRADERHEVQGGAFLLHAGNERQAEVRLVDAAGRPAEEPVFRSLTQWTHHTYAEADGPVRVEVGSPVWLVPQVPRVVTERAVSFGCIDVGSRIFWDVDTEEVVLGRDDGDAPRVRFFTPRAGQAVPDEAVVLQHTVLLDPGGSPLYFEVVQVGQECTGSVTLEAGRAPGASPFAESLVDLLVALVLVGATIALVLTGIWWVGLRRDRRRRQAAEAVL